MASKISNCGKFLLSTEININIGDVINGSNDFCVKNYIELSISFTIKKQKLIVEWLYADGCKVYQFNQEVQDKIKTEVCLYKMFNIKNKKEFGQLFFRTFTIGKENIYSNVRLYFF